MAHRFTDSLSVPDALHHGPGAFASDTLLSLRPDSAALISGGPHERLMSTADAVYGHLSELSAPVYTAHSAPAALTDNIFFDIAVLACFVIFCLTLYLYRGYAFGIFNVIRGAAATEKMLGEQSKVFGEFLFRTITTGLLVAGLITLKFIDMWLAESLTYDPSLWGSLALIPGAWGAMALIWGLQFALIGTAGNLTLTSNFTARLFFLRKITFAVWTVSVLPFFLLFALSDGQNATFTGIIIVAISVLAGFFLIIRSFTLFLRHNISISLWFLYLCAVEIFPVSLAAMVAGRFLL